MDERFKMVQFEVGGCQAMDVILMELWNRKLNTEQKAEIGLLVLNSRFWIIQSHSIRST